MAKRNEKGTLPLTQLLAIEVSTAFVLSDDMRIMHENDPEQSPGPRFFFTGCANGNLLNIYQDVDDEVARRIRGLLADEPPWLTPDVLPVGLPAVIDLLERDRPVVSTERSLVYYLRGNSVVANDIHFVCSGTEEGWRLLDDLRQTGAPKHLVAAGFIGVDDFWAPWCAVMDGHIIAALAFAARLGTQGAEVGVYTFPGWRSRGYASAAVAKWSSLSDLVGLELFYSTTAENSSSQRVAERLQLQRFAAGLAVR